MAKKKPDKKALLKKISDSRDWIALMKLSFADYSRTGDPEKVPVRAVVRSLQFFERTLEEIEEHLNQ